ncbi:MAG: hypothetical protein HQK76_16125 [Desulfobacterales bacterium]|nr:hypothetical protein [Desulfobacterales bacterium]
MMSQHYRNYFFLLLFIIGSCQTNIKKEISDLATSIPAGKRISVPNSYDSNTGEVNGLGCYLRDKIESSIDTEKYHLVPREDLVIFFDEKEFDMHNKVNVDSQKNTEKIDSDIAIASRYYFIKNEENIVELEIRVLDLKSERRKILNSRSCIVSIPDNYQDMICQKKGNIYKSGLENISTNSRNKPKLSGNLNKNCYEDYEQMSVNIKTEKGVYLYIFNLAADHTVTILYPNVYMPSEPLSIEKFEFPPKKNPNIKYISVSSLPDEDSSKESIKIVASKIKMDFSFLPVPINSYYAGAKGGDIKKMLDVLKTNQEWSEIDIPYIVGKDCKK